MMTGDGSRRAGTMARPEPHALVWYSPAMVDVPAAIRVNRAPVLTLWAAVVAERLGHPRETALSLAGAVAGTAARAKARRLGLVEHRGGEDAASTKPRDTARLLGKEVALTHDADGIVLADAGGGKPGAAAPVAAYVIKAFGNRLAETRAAMEELAGRFEPGELNRIGFRLYEAFRPEVPGDMRGWGAKGELDLQKIRAAAELPEWAEPGSVRRFARSRTAGPCTSPGRRIDRHPPPTR